MMNQRWTKPRADGKPHNGIDPFECAHCEHVYQEGFNVETIILHCRDKHREFYRHKWETELANGSTVDPRFAPID